jgi:hypothetical protein
MEKTACSTVACAYCVYRAVAWQRVDQIRHNILCVIEWYEVGGVVLWAVVRRVGGSAVGSGEEGVFFIKISNMELCVSVHVSFICKPFLVMSYI